MMCSDFADDKILNNMSRLVQKLTLSGGVKRVLNFVVTVVVVG